MNKTKNIIIIITIVILCALTFFAYKNFSKTSSVESSSLDQTFDNNGIYESAEFSDGLNNPDSETTYPLDESETGIAKKSIYVVDINQDGEPDRITKTYFENWNAHSYYKYFIELNVDGKYVDITPKGLQTTNGADCDLQQIQFKLKPNFQIIVIYREMGDTWDTPTMAHKKVFSWQNNMLRPSSPIQMQPICDVKELF